MGLQEILQKTSLTNEARRHFLADAPAYLTFQLPYQAMVNSTVGLSSEQAWKAQVIATIGTICIAPITKSLWHKYWRKGIGVNENAPEGAQKKADAAGFGLLGVASAVGSTIATYALVGANNNQTAAAIGASIVYSFAVGGPTGYLLALNRDAAGYKTSERASIAKLTQAQKRRRMYCSLALATAIAAGVYAVDTESLVATAQAIPSRVESTIQSIIK